MSWTDSRVELLKKLWQDGLSASQISAQLGGVTRNAVIGKVHRLGLDGRAAPTNPARATRLQMPRSTRPTAAFPRRITRAIPATSRPRICYVDEAPGMATVETLSAHMCKWPIGDPALDNFTLCGRRVARNGPYCCEHAQVAYQPAQPGKKTSASDLARSLRRYL